MAVTVAMALSVGLGWTRTPVFAGGGTPTLFAVRGTTGNAYSMSGNDSTFAGFGGAYTNLGGGLLGAPTVVSVPLSFAQAPGPGTPYFIATGTDSSLWVRSQTVGWRHLSSAFVDCTSIPGATGVSAHAAGGVLLVVACRGTDGALWYALGEVASDPNVLPSLTSWQSLGGQVAAPIGMQLDGPAVAAVAPTTSVNEELTFFVNGTDGRVWTRTLNSPWTPMPWSCRGHLAAATVDLITVFACHGTNDQAWVSSTRGSGWCAAASIGGVLVDGPGVAFGPTTVTVVAEGTDGAAYQSSALTSVARSGCYDVSNFGGFGSLGGVLTNGATAAALLFQNDNP